MSQSLHEKYVPILRFARGERFFPMAVEDFFGYSSLRQKGQEFPLLDTGRVTPALLAGEHEYNPDVYLQSIPPTLAGQNVAARWSKDLLRTLADVSTKASHWREGLARIAYDWFSAKTEAATQLFWWNDLVMDRLGAGRRDRGDLPRLDLPPEVRQAAVQNYEHSQLARPNYTYYWRTTVDGRYLCLQYWLFYGYNDWATGFGGMNDHEGDWEGLYLFFELGTSGNPIEPPAYVTFVGHHSRLTKPWRHPDVTLDGTHPVAYVAAGSHATYPERRAYDLISLYGLVDYATGDGEVIRPDDWQQRVDLQTQPWVRVFQGTWGTRYWLPFSWLQDMLGRLSAGGGEISLPGISAPLGPRYGADGAIRPNWLSPVSWAGIPELEKS